MDVEKTMEFILEQQARFETNFARFEANFARFEAGMEELRQSHQATERLVRRLARWGAARLRQHEERMDEMEQRREEDRREFHAFLQRFDDFLRGQRGDGH
jgi:NADH:ubiquinone oxidoreductase subunit D